MEMATLASVASALDDDDAFVAQALNSTESESYTRKSILKKGVKQLIDKLTPKKNVTWATDTKYNVFKKRKKKSYFTDIFTSEDSILATSDMSSVMRPATFLRLPEHAQQGLIKLLPEGDSLQEILASPQLKQALQQWQMDLSQGLLDPEIRMQLIKKKPTRADDEIVSMEEAFKRAGWVCVAGKWEKSTESKKPVARGKQKEVQEVGEEVVKLPYGEMPGWGSQASGLKIKIHIFPELGEAYLCDSSNIEGESDKGCICGKEFAPVKRRRKGEIIKSFWVGCDECGRWCHSECVPDYKDGDDYYCPDCTLSLPEPKSSPTLKDTSEQLADKASTTTDCDARIPTFTSDDEDESLRCDKCQQPGVLTGPLPCKLIPCHCGNAHRHIMCNDANQETKRFMCSPRCRSCDPHQIYGGKGPNCMPSCAFCVVCRSIESDNVVYCDGCDANPDCRNRIHIDCMQEEYSEGDEWRCDECCE